MRINQSFPRLSVRFYNDVYSKQFTMRFYTASVESRSWPVEVERKETRRIVTGCFKGY